MSQSPYGKLLRMTSFYTLLRAYLRNANTVALDELLTLLLYKHGSVRSREIVKREAEGIERIKSQRKNVNLNSP